MAAQSMTVNTSCTALPNTTDGSETIAFVNTVLRGALSEVTDRGVVSPRIGLLHSVHHEVSYKYNMKPDVLVLTTPSSHLLLIVNA
jgi:hypothetical protein